MEAERKAGYPIKTHPPEQQYQAAVELVLDRREAARELLRGADGMSAAGEISAIHAYPVVACYTSVYAGRATIVGLRGYAAHCAIEALGAANQQQAGLLEWMYGDAAGGGAADPGA